ncbi:MAG TPA: PhzF family phenazine biosynthesis protein [Gemmatimonadaceae bacterium]|nr:PhzF family phenazine biosynthesis protein [Gemmatimonadaceae bacterium]
MPAHHYVTLDVFTSVPFGGNPLAVFPDAPGISEASLLAIAREFNYSETTFCYPPANPAHTRRVRIFTPGGEIPFAGHPTIGTAIVLHALGEPGAAPGTDAHLVLEEGVGPVPVTVRAGKDGTAFARFSVAQLPEIGPMPPPRTALAEILSLDTEDVLGAPNAPQAISCGIPFLLVPLRSVEAVSRARLRIERWEATLASSWAPEVFVFAHDPGGGAAHYRARMFAPRLNVPEDPATGSAAACFAGYLAARAQQPDGTFAWTVDQGIEMRRASRLEIEADKTAGTITAIRVGGRAVLISEGTLRAP